VVLCGIGILVFFGDVLVSDISLCLSVSRSLGLSVSRSLGLSVSRSLGLSVSRSLGLSVSRSLGLSVSLSEGPTTHHIASMKSLYQRFALKAKMIRTVPLFLRASTQSSLYIIYYNVTSRASATSAPSRGGPC
jgi:hypothetical protein